MKSLPSLCLPFPQPPAVQCVQCTSAVEWVNTLPEDLRSSIIKHR